MAVALRCKLSTHNEQILQILSIDLLQILQATFLSKII